jgi:DNA invertase Pin-like site-specific DNA recombinase
LAFAIPERVRSGMANAKSKGVKLGRPQTTAEQIPQIFYRHYPSYKSGNLNISEFARVCGLSRTTVYKYVGLLEG